MPPIYRKSVPIVCGSQTAINAANTPGSQKDCRSDEFSEEHGQNVHPSLQRLYFCLT